MFKERIHFLSTAIDLTLIQRAEEIYKVQYAISNFLEKKEWIISGKVAIDINNKEETVFKILKDFKRTIHKNTLLKKVSDDFLDDVSSSLIIYYLKYNDNSVFIRYILGRKNDISQYNEILIYNYKTLIDILGFRVFKELIRNISNLLSVMIIKVPTQDLALELQGVLDSSIDIQIIENP